MTVNELLDFLATCPGDAVVVYAPEHGGEDAHEISDPEVVRYSKKKQKIVDNPKKRKNAICFWHS